MYQKTPKTRMRLCSKESVQNPGNLLSHYFSRNKRSWGTKAMEKRQKHHVQDGGALECSGLWLSSMVLSMEFITYFLGNVLGQANYVYSCQELINYGLQINGVITQDFHRANNIPMDIARPLGCPWIVVSSVKQWRWRRERKQKRGCRAGLLARL